MSGAKTMTPLALQVPPRPLEAAQTDWGGPPKVSIFLSFPGTKNPTNRLSGDQKAKEASSVPSSGWAVSESRGRIHRTFFPESSIAAKTIRVPSGERAGPPVGASKANEFFSGGRMYERTARVR